MRNKILCTLLIFSCAFHAQAVGQRTLSDSTKTSQDLKFKYSSLIIPTVLIGYGFAGLESTRIKTYNLEVNERIHGRMTIDDFSLFIPVLSVYGLNAMGLKGRNNFKRRTIILATSSLLMGSTGLRIKSISNIKRPDGSTNNSFPSGHTAIAFMGAEFLWQEYKNVSVWIGVAGYLVATGTGYLRIYNDRHWLTDVAAGAGIGIISTKIAYWINPLVMNKLFHDNTGQQTNINAFPYYNGKQAGFSLSLTF